MFASTPQEYLHGQWPRHTEGSIQRLPALKGNRDAIQNFTSVADRGSNAEQLPLLLRPRADAVGQYKSIENQLQHKACPPIKLSTSTNLTISAPASSEPRHMLDFVIQKSDKTHNYKNLLLSKVLKDSNVTQFFEIYAKYFGVPLSSLTKLTFGTGFGHNQDFVVRRYAGSRLWEKFKKRLSNLL